MGVTSFWPAALAGCVCGVVSGLGIGGGSILMVWLTAAAALDQRTAQGINLLFFLPTAAAALIFHGKNKVVFWPAVFPAAVFGCITAAVSAWFASSIDVALLQKLFGGFLIAAGISELSKKNGQARA